MTILLAKRVRAYLRINLDSDRFKHVMEQQRRFKIFLSYAAEQLDLAEKIYLALVNYGHDVFFDRTSLPPGKDYNPAILEQIRNSDLFVFLISPQSVENGAYARTELKFAREVWDRPEGHVIPVMAIDTPIESIPNYLTAVTFLKTEGNLPAELAAAISDLSSGWSQEKTVLGQSEIIKETRENLNKLEMSQKLADIERAWNIEKLKYYVKKPDGSEVEPMPAPTSVTVSGIIFGGMIALLLSNINIAVGTTIGLIVFFLFYSIVIKMNRKAEIYYAAERQYQKRRESIIGSDALTDIDSLSGEQCIDRLRNAGFKFIQKGLTDWLIIEPMGGRVRISSLKDLQEYTKGK